MNLSLRWLPFALLACLAPAARLGSFAAQQWAVAVGPGATVEESGGVFTVRGPENVYAYASQPGGTDLIRLSATIKAGGGISWCPSVFLYWDASDWCQLGVVPGEGGRFYACEVEKLTGPDAVDHIVPTERYLAPAAYGEPHRVAIELGRDVIRYLGGDENGPLKPLLAIRRPEGFAGAPKLLIVGKGYGRGDAEYRQPELRNSFRDPGKVVTSTIRGVTSGPLEPARVSASAAERNFWRADDRDADGDAILAGGRDPSFAAVAKLYPPMQRPREAVGVKDHPDDIAVEPDGSITLLPQKGKPVSGWFEMDIPPVKLAPKRIAADQPGGTVVLARTAGGLNYKFRMAGWSRGMAPNSRLSALVRIEIGNPGRPAKVFVLRFKTSQGTSAQFRDLVPMQSSAPEYLEWPMGGTPVRLEQQAGDRKWAEAEASWQALRDGGAHLQLPERRMMAAASRWLAYSYLNVDKVGKRYEPRDGVGFYEEVYGYSAALYCNALDMWGRHADSRRYLESLLSFQNADGSVIVNYGLPDMGSLLYAMAQHYRFTGDAAWLTRMAPRMIRICDWLDAHRDRASTNPLTRGLIKLRPYCDFHEPTYNYDGNAEACVGMEEAAKAFAEVGLKAQAARAGAEAHDFRQEILASMRTAVFERNGMKILPLEPDTRRIEIDARYRADDYYGLIGLRLLECGFLKYPDPLAKIVTDFVENRSGLRLGMCRFRGTMIDHAYTYGWWLDCLRSGREERALLGLYGSLAYGMSRDTYAGVEVTDLATGHNEMTLPHLYSSTQQLRLLRMLLVREEGDDLLLAQAPPRGWLQPNGVVAMRSAGTLFGPVSYEIRAESNGRYRVTVDAPPRLRGTLRIRLRNPGRQPIARLTVNGQPSHAFHGDWITLSRPHGHYELRAWLARP